MKDETYAFISDVKEKKITARSARHTRTHCGKGGRVRLPSDNLSKKELMKMNGECKSYRLNDPMAWNEFKAMPDDVKVTYIKLLRQKFNVPDAHLTKMMGINTCSFSNEMKRLGLAVGKRKYTTPWDKEGFCAWVNGVDKLPAPVVEEMPIEDSVQEEPEAVIIEEVETFVEDDLPFEEPEAIAKEDIPYIELYQNHGKEAFGSIRPNYAELEAELEKAKAENEWLRNECDNQRIHARILEAQMDVVRLIFGGKNNG